MDPPEGRQGVRACDESEEVGCYFAKAPKQVCERQAQLHLPSRKLVVDVSTRWNSSLDMLACFWEQQPAVLNTLLLKTEEVKVNLTEVIKSMCPLKVTATLLRKNIQPSQ